MVICFCSLCRFLITLYHSAFIRDNPLSGNKKKPAGLAPMLFFFVKGIDGTTLGALAGLAPSFFQLAAFFAYKFGHSLISFI
jgi:hypothetical protein